MILMIFPVRRIEASGVCSRVRNKLARYFFTVKKCRKVWWKKEKTEKGKKKNWHSNPTWRMASLQAFAAATAACLAAADTFETKGAAPLHDALLGLPFSNYDEVTRGHNFSMRTVSSIYLETETPLKARWAWADGQCSSPPPQPLRLSKLADTAEQRLRVPIAQSIPQQYRLGAALPLV